MDPILISFLVGTIGGALGGLLAAIAGATIMYSASRQFRAAILSFSAGFILSTAFLEMLTRALKSLSGWEIAAVVGGVLVGAAIRATATFITGHYLTGDLQKGEAGYRHAEARKIAYSLVIVNVVEGLTIGIAFVVGRGLGVLISFIMIFENFAEGISVSAELAQGG